MHQHHHPTSLLLLLFACACAFPSPVAASSFNSANSSFIFMLSLIAFIAVLFCLLCCSRSPADANKPSNGVDVNDPELGGEVIDTSALAALSEDSRLSYERARAWQENNPPESLSTDITISQYLSIQEKGVSAWEFDPDIETNIYVEGRTEISFYYGESCVQTNLPLPKNQEVYYWEAKMFEKPSTTTVSIGVSTKPYPNWRLPGYTSGYITFLKYPHYRSPLDCLPRAIPISYPLLTSSCSPIRAGWNRHSIGYFSDTGNKRFNQPFIGRVYGPPFNEGDVIGVGYRHRTGTVFFTRNGRKLDDAYTGLRFNLFPTVGANGPCQVHVNLGQAGFVFVEANVKKWGLAPMHGTLPPPPAYGSERGSVLLETGTPRPSEEAARSSLQLTGHGSEDHHRLLGPADAHSSHQHPRSHAVDISLSDIAVPPPAYSSNQNSPARDLQVRGTQARDSPGRSSILSDSSETALLADDSTAEGRTSYEQRTSTVEEEARAVARRETRRESRRGRRA
ncbi:SPRY domain-containing protein [Jimgerdemannia flammicorona]|uniref:SPRY domain-containing protein n=1 Tax=Jimgerdemannia flammicorona TaxID=994334 RepID=A0A433QBK2_9FUNG|nr:SPRY domain-containing protein [Jimgerdemannia flammicorona]